VRILTSKSWNRVLCVKRQIAWQCLQTCKVDIYFTQQCFCFFFVARYFLRLTCCWLSLFTRYTFCGSIISPIAALCLYLMRLWTFGVKRRHQSGGHFTHNRQFPTGGQLQPCIYLARLRRYGASSILGSRLWPLGVTWRHRSRDHWTRNI